MAKKHYLRRYLFTGLIVITPVGLTVFVLTWAFQRLDGIFGGPIQDLIGREVPGLGVMFLLLAVMAIGWVVHQAAGRQLLQWWNRALVKFPLTGRIYGAASQIVQTLVGERTSMFSRPVLVPYPTEGMWAVAFVTKETPEILESVVGEPSVNVFVPTTPNPTSGFMLIVPNTRIRELDLPVEEAMKLVISAGAVTPLDRNALRRTGGLDVEHLLRGHE